MRGRDMSMPNPRSMHIWNDQNPMRQMTGLNQSIGIFSTTFLKFKPSSTFPPFPSIYDSPVSYALSPGTWNTFNSFLNLDLEPVLPYLFLSSFPIMASTPEISVFPHLKNPILMTIVLKPDIENEPPLQHGGSFLSGHREASRPNLGRQSKSAKGSFK